MNLVIYTQGLLSQKEYLATNYKSVQYEKISCFFIRVFFAFVL